MAAAALVVLMRPAPLGRRTQAAALAGALMATEEEEAAVRVSMEKS
jgi:hypothetical protein